jgi:hypothetical protein
MACHGLATTVFGECENKSSVMPRDCAKREAREISVCVTISLFAAAFHSGNFLASKTEIYVGFLDITVSIDDGCNALQHRLPGK